MSRAPYRTGECGRDDPSLDRIAERIERYAADKVAEPSTDLVLRIHQAIDAEPAAPVGRWASLTAGLRPVLVSARALAVVGVLMAAVVGAVALGDVARLVREAGVGASPPPPSILAPAPSETPSTQAFTSAAPSLSPSASPSPSPSPSPSATSSPSPSSTPIATPSDHELETPEPSESEDDNSGPGGGDDNSGPGGGGDDNSGPGGGGDDNSGPGGGD